MPRLLREEFRLGVAKGDRAGHRFRGNQWKRVAGAFGLGTTFGNSGITVPSDDQVGEFLTPHMMEEDYSLDQDPTFIHDRNVDITGHYEDEYDLAPVPRKFVAGYMAVRDTLDKLLLPDHNYRWETYDVEDLQQAHLINAPASGFTTRPRRGEPINMSFATQFQSSSEAAHLILHEATHAYLFEGRGSSELTRVGRTLADELSRKLDDMDGENTYLRYAWEYGNSGGPDELIPDIVATMRVSPKTMRASMDTIWTSDEARAALATISNEFEIDLPADVSKDADLEIKAELNVFPRHLGVREGETWTVAARRWLRAEIGKGDKKGHRFRGNQWKKIAGLFGSPRIYTEPAHSSNEIGSFDSRMEKYGSSPAELADSIHKLLPNTDRDEIEELFQESFAEMVDAAMPDTDGPIFSDQRDAIQANVLEVFLNMATAHVEAIDHLLQDHPQLAKEFVYAGPWITDRNDPEGVTAGMTAFSDPVSGRRGLWLVYDPISVSLVSQSHSLGENYNSTSSDFYRVATANRFGGEGAIVDSGDITTHGDAAAALAYATTVHEWGHALTYYAATGIAQDMDGQDVTVGMSTADTHGPASNLYTEAGGKVPTFWSQADLWRFSMDFSKSAVGARLDDGPTEYSRAMPAEWIAEVYALSKLGADVDLGVDLRPGDAQVVRELEALVDKHPDGLNGLVGPREMTVGKRAWPVPEYAIVERWDPNSIVGRFVRSRAANVSKRFDPHQPRVPKGMPGAGRWLGLLGRVKPIKETQRVGGVDVPRYAESDYPGLRDHGGYVKAALKAGKPHLSTDMIDPDGRRHRLSLKGKLAAANWMTTGGKRGGMPGFRHFDYTKDGDKILQQMIDNLRVLQKVAEDREKSEGFITRTRQWYDGANRLAADLGQKHNLDPDAAAGVLASLSPSMDWDNNVFMAKELLNVLDDNPAVSWYDLSTIAALAEDLNAGKKPGDRGWFEPKFPQVGTRVVDVEDEMTRALLVRGMIYRRSGGDPRTPILRIAENGEIVATDKPMKKTRFQSRENMAKAISIALNPTKENLDAQLGSGVKVRSFYNNIAYPNDPADDVTIDTHAASSLVGAPYAANTEPFKSITESSTKEDGALVKQMMIEAFRTVAKENPQWYSHPREAQSVLWELWREAAESSTKAAKERKQGLRDAWAAVDEPGGDDEAATAAAREAAIAAAREAMVSFLTATTITKESQMGNLGPVDPVIQHDGPDEDGDDDEIDRENAAWDAVFERAKKTDLGADFRHRSLKWRSELDA